MNALKTEEQTQLHHAAPAPLGDKPWTSDSRRRLAHAVGAKVDLLLVAAAMTLPVVPNKLWTHALVGALLLGLRRALWKLGMPRWCRPARRTMLVVGGPSAALELSHELGERSGGRLDVVGSINLQRQTVADVVAALHAHPIDCVALQVGKATADKLDEVLHACELEGVEVWLMAADLVHPKLARTSVEQLGERPVVVYRSTPAPSLARVGKRIVDIVATGFALLIIGPLIILPAMIAIKLTAPGPIFFGQVRVGRHGRHFKMWKLRSMVVNAERIKMDLLASNDMDGPVFKMKKDPRVTKVGRILRKLSIDELPQLWNVLRGEMSLVGPRPAVPKEVAQYQPWQRRRLSVTPGLTCIWQVSGRNKIGFEEWMKMDLRYIDTWSLGQDLKLIALTVPVAAVGYGAS
jgi:exopolysaccharide biosynthesis polyprenyl glycosylphosphotransferase